MRKLLGGAVAAALALFAFHGAASAAEPIKVGFSMAMTGAVAQNGKQLLIASKDDSFQARHGFDSYPRSARKRGLRKAALLAQLSNTFSETQSNVVQLGTSGFGWLLGGATVELQQIIVIRQVYLDAHAVKSRDPDDGKCR